MFLFYHLIIYIFLRIHNYIVLFRDCNKWRELSPGYSSFQKAHNHDCVDGLLIKQNKLKLSHPNANPVTLPRKHDLPFQHSAAEFLLLDYLDLSQYVEVTY